MDSSAYKPAFSSFVRRRPYVTIGLAIAFCALMFYLFFYRAPSDFPVGTVITVSKGMTVKDIASELRQDDIIRSPFVFTRLVMLLGRDKGISIGTYYFEKRLSVLQVARRLARGMYNDSAERITIPEGSSVIDIAAIINKKYPAFDKTTFVTMATHKEGYLFPDTYDFSPGVTPQAVISMMNANFAKKVLTPQVQSQVSASGHSLQDIVIMASILEREARLPETRRIVAGILWQRIKDGIPLQVDSSFEYVNGKTSSELTLKDLKIDSAYNTYTHKGLPPTPISNPGLDSIIDAMNPIKTAYLYFLTDNNGTMHYATTLAQHVQNKKLYLGD